jgi:hypothetical protein
MPSELLGFVGRGGEGEGGCVYCMWYVYAWVCVVWGEKRGRVDRGE